MIRCAATWSRAATILATPASSRAVAAADATVRSVSRRLYRAACCRNAVGVAYAGFLLAGVGALLIFLVVRVDELVSVVPCEEGERVVVALRAQRFAPLFRERLEGVARREGAPPAC